MSGARGPLDFTAHDFAHSRTCGKPRQILSRDVEWAVSQKNCNEKKHKNKKGGIMYHPSQALQMHAETTSARHNSGCASGVKTLEEQSQQQIDCFRPHRASSRAA